MLGCDSTVACNALRANVHPCSLSPPPFSLGAFPCFSAFFSLQGGKRSQQRHLSRMPLLFPLKCQITRGYMGREYQVGTFAKKPNRSDYISILKENFGTLGDPLKWQTKEIQKLLLHQFLSRKWQNSNRFKI